MATTITNSSITFNDATVQTTKASTLGTPQLSSISSNFNTGGTSYSTVNTTLYFGRFTGEYSGNWDSQNSVFCGFQAYFNYTYNTDNDSPRSGADSQNILIRMVYRSIS